MVVLIVFLKNIFTPILEKIYPVKLVLNYNKMWQESFEVYCRDTVYTSPANFMA